MLRASILHFDKSWDKCLSLAEFSYNNSYQASLKMAPFDALYGQRCRTPLTWLEAGERTLFGPDLVKDAEERVQVIRENLKMAQMRQKSYHDKGTAPRDFELGDYVYLKVSPTKDVQRFSVKDVTQLKKGMPVPENEVITEANAWIEPDFSLIEHPLRILDQNERKTRRQTVRMYKIQWSHHTEEEATWETEDYLNTKYPGFLESQNREFFSPSSCYQIESQDEIPFKGVGCNAPGF
jgi:hypothetical protein